MSRRNPRRERYKEHLAPVSPGWASVNPWPVVPNFNFDTSGFPKAPLHTEYQVDTTGYLMNYSNPCFHVKYHYAGLGVQNFEMVVTGSPVSPIRQFQFGGRGLYPGDLYDRIMSSVTMPSSDWLADFAAQADDKFRRAVDVKAFLVNFIIELLQLCDGNISAIKKWIDRLKSAISLFQKILKETGNAWLAWNFAIKPTLKDLREFADVYGKSLRRLEYLRRRNHKDTRVQIRGKPYRFDVPSVDLPCSEMRLLQEMWPEGFTLVVSDMSEISHWRLKDISVKIEPTAVATVRYEIPDELLEGWPAHMIVANTMLGLYRPLEIIWEAIPFSWLLDWFLTQRIKLLKAKARLDMLELPDAQLIASCWTLKTKLTAELCYLTPPNRYNVREEQRLGIINLEIYNRRPGLPTVDASPFTVPLEWYNASILAAIIATKRRKRGKGQPGS